MHMNWNFGVSQGQIKAHNCIYSFTINYNQQFVGKKCMTKLYAVLLLLLVIRYISRYEQWLSNGWTLNCNKTFVSRFSFLTDMNKWSAKDHGNRGHDSKCTSHFPPLCFNLAKKNILKPTSFKPWCVHDDTETLLPPQNSETDPITSRLLHQHHTILCLQ